MKWGFAWELGPFEVWDAIGVEKMAGALAKQGKEIPALVQKVLATPGKTFYETAKGTTQYFDQATSTLKTVADRPGVTILRALKDRIGVVQKNSGASLIDLGEGIVCCEFHSKMNSIGSDLVAMIHAGLKRLGTDFEGMVIANQAPNFSVGANLMLVLVAAQEQEWTTSIWP